MTYAKTQHFLAALAAAAAFNAPDSAAQSWESPLQAPAPAPARAAAETFRWDLPPPKRGTAIQPVKQVPPARGTAFLPEKQVPPARETAFLPEKQVPPTRETAFLPEKHVPPARETVFQRSQSSPPPYGSSYGAYDPAPRGGGDEWYASDYELNLFSQHLDVVRRRPYSYGGMYTPDTAFGPYGTSAVLELSFDARLFNHDDFLAGHAELRAFGHLTYFLENPDMSNLPDALLEAGLELGMAWRFVNGWSTEVRAAPGVYSDITAPAFGVPLTLNFYFAVNPALSLQLGGTLRPGWDIPFIPNLSLAWFPAEEIRIDLGLPRSKITLFDGWMISPFAAFEWRNTTYALDGAKEGVPDDLTLDDMMISAGVAVTPTASWTLSAEYGKFIQRELSADVAENYAMNLSKEAFFRIMVRGEF